MQRDNFFHSIRSHNPFYLLSALCMLGSCVLLGQSLSIEPGNQPELLLLMSVLQVYELLLIGLGLYLIARRRLWRDGATLLVLEVVFLMDGTHLQGELAAGDAKLGAVAGLAALVLVLVKLAVVARGLGLRLDTGMLVFCGLSFSFVTGLPVLARALSEQGRLSEGLFYGGWWAVGFAFAFLALVLADWGRRDSSDAAWWFRTALAYFACASMALHLAALHWTYRFELPASYLAPALLGASVFLCRRELASRWKQRLAWQLPLAALFLATSDSSDVVFAVASVPVTPFRAILVGSALVYVHHASLRGLAGYVWASLGLFVAALLGESPRAIAGGAGQLLGKLLPTSKLELGVAGVVMAFVLLFVGAWSSLRKEGATFRPGYTRGSRLS